MSWLEAVASDVVTCDGSGANSRSGTPIEELGFISTDEQGCVSLA